MENRKTDNRTNRIWIGSAVAFLVSAGTAWFWLTASPEPASSPQTPASEPRAASPEPAPTPKLADEPLPIPEILPQVERLAAPIPSPRQEPRAASPEQLNREAEQLIRETDLLLHAKNLSVPALSEAEQADIEQRPEFQAGLEQEALLEQRLESLVE